MWSLGCVLFEMIFCSTSYENKVGNCEAFKGDSAYPLEPKGHRTISEDD